LLADVVVIREIVSEILPFFGSIFNEFGAGVGRMRVPVAR